MQPVDYSAITIDRIALPGAAGKEIAVEILRLDKIHPVISGNKIFKLQFYLQEAAAQGKTMIETYGGAWSNHIAATAEACRLAGISCTGFIRGEEPEHPSATLTAAAEAGMRLVYLDRETYRLQKRNLQPVHPHSYVIPEGGFGKKGAMGASTILQQFDTTKYTHICCAAGTGTMAAGIALAATPMQQVLAFSALKNNHQLKEDIEQMTGTAVKQPLLLHDYHVGGFAKFTMELIRFMNECYAENAVPSDFVYTGKLLFAVNDLLARDFFPAGSNILLIHSGGLQGNASLEKGTLIF